MSHNRKPSRRRISRTGKTPSTTPPGVNRNPTGEQLEEEMVLEMFVSTHSLPQRAKVTEGYDDPYNTDNSFSNGDVIEVRRVLCPFVTLTFQHPVTACDVRLTVPTRNATRFKLCASNSNQRKATVYGCVRQIVEFWPLAVMAKHKYKQRDKHCYNNVSKPASETDESSHVLFSPGDVLRVVRLDRSHDTDVPQVVVEFKNVSTLELFQLPVDYVGPFTEVFDNTRPYTLGELADMARVPRKLHLSMSDQPQPSDEPNSTASSCWIPGIPRDFDGVINVEKPDYLVEIGIVTDLEDDYEEVGDVLEESGTEIGTGKDGKKLNDGVLPRFLVPIDSGINLIACEADYVSLSHKQCPLEHLSQKPESALPRMAQIIHWDEETTILQHHLIRPGDVIVLYRLETMRKLAVKAGQRHFLLPVNHPSRFRLVNKSTSGTIKCCQLSEILATRKLPFTLMLEESTNVTRIADEDILPRKTLLKVQSVVEEQTVVVAKISCGDHLKPAFHLPLRTRLEVCFMSRWKGSVAVHAYSRWDGMAEEISKQVYDDVTGHKCDDYLEPSVFPTSKPPLTQSKKDDIHSTWPQPPPPLTPPLSPSIPTVTPPLPPLTPPPHRGGTLNTKVVPPLPPRGTVAQRSATLPGNLTLMNSLSTSCEMLSSPRSPGLDKFLQLVKERPLRSRSFDSEDLESSDDSDYERIDEDVADDVIEDGYITASRSHQPVDEEPTDLTIPEDGNVCSFSAAQMQLLLRQLNAPLETLQTWNKLAVDGRKFALMSDETLAGYRLNKSLIRYFRDRSRLNIQ